MISPFQINSVFAQTAHGLLAARVDDLAWLAIPSKDGLRMASAWRLSKPIEEWIPGDFVGSDGVVAHEAAFRAHVEDVAQHKRELMLLPRIETNGRASTPWGRAQQSFRYADEIVCHSTAGHGGFYLSSDRNAKVIELLRNEDGWYEEDCEWAKVAFTFPELFTDRERCQAAKTLRHDYPDAWEQVHGVTLVPGESRVKDERAFRTIHAADWVVVAALRSDRHFGMIECVARLGGNRSSGAECLFLVPADEYQAGRFGFVIDECRHARSVSAAA